MKNYSDLLVKDFLKVFIFLILPFFLVVTLGLFLIIGSVKYKVEKCGGIAKCIGGFSAKIEKDFREGKNEHQ